MIESKRGKLVGEFIKKKRESMGMSQRALGLLFSPPVTTQFISNVERGVTPLPPTHIPVLAKALAVSDSEIMALLEREYTLRLNGRLGKTESLEGISPSLQNHLEVADGDYQFIKSLYEAYRMADAKTKQGFASVCENLLKVAKSNNSL